MEISKGLGIMVVIAVAVWTLYVLSLGAANGKWRGKDLEDDVEVHDDDMAFYMEGPYRDVEDGKWYWHGYTGARRGPYDSEALAKKAHKDYLDMFVEDEDAVQPGNIRI